MKRVRFSPVRLRWVAFRTLLLAMLVSEAAGLLIAYRRYVRALGELAKVEHRVAALSRSNPVPSAQNVEGMRAVVARLEAEVSSLRGPARSIVPSSAASRAEAYFALQAYAGRLRTLAAGHAVEHRAGETWGFDTYRREGPADNLREQVLQQCRDLEDILGALLQTAPRRIERIQREQPEGDSPDGRRTNVRDTDFFVQPAYLRMEASPTGRVRAYRLTFVGNTGTLRRWINVLSGLQGPVVVRDVSAEPVWKGESLSASAAVWPHFTRFSVVVAFLDDGGAP